MVPEEPQTEIQVLKELPSSGARPREGIAFAAIEAVALRDLPSPGHILSKAHIGTANKTNTLRQNLLQTIYYPHKQRIYHEITSNTLSMQLDGYVEHGRMHFGRSAQRK